MNGKSKLNGSVNLLAQAMRDVFHESMNEVRDGMNEDLKVLEEGLRDEIRSANGTTNENMQVQFAEQEKKIGKLIAKKPTQTNKTGSTVRK